MTLIFKEVQITQNECTGFECNRCTKIYHADDIVEMQEMFRWYNTGGYGSVWGDGIAAEVTLCQKCTFELFGKFATIHNENYE